MLLWKAMKQKKPFSFWIVPLLLFTFKSRWVEHRHNGASPFIKSLMCYSFQCAPKYIDSYTIYFTFKPQIILSSSKSLFLSKDTIIISYQERHVHFYFCEMFIWILSPNETDFNVTEVASMPTYKFFFYLFYSSEINFIKSDSRIYCWKSRGTARTVHCLQQTACKV